MFESFLGREKAFPDYKKNKPKKVENLEFFYIGKIAQQNVFESIVKRKQVFPDYKNNKLKKWIKIGIFRKRLVHGFGERFFFYLEHYSTLFLSLF